MNMMKSLPETEKNVIVVLSGGLDSTIMTHLLVHKYGKDRVKAITFLYGQKQIVETVRACETAEILDIDHHHMHLGILGDIAKKVSANIEGTTIDMPTIKDVLGDPQPKTYVPFRNLILMSFALSYAEAQDASHIFCGLQSRDLYGYWDTSGEFINKLNAITSLNRQHKIKVEAPFVDITKKEELEVAKFMGFLPLLKHTLSCYNPDSEEKLWCVPYLCRTDKSFYGYW